MRGRVLSGSNNVFDVAMPDGTMRRCTLKGKKLRGADGSWAGFYNPLAPGDMVELDDGTGQIAALEPRQNAFTRWNEKGRAPQVLAANVDQAVLVTTPEEPPFRPRFIDRALIQAAWCHIAPLIVVNKADLPFDSEMESRLATWVKLGYPVQRVSAKSGGGIAQLAETLAGKTSVFVGQSGVGKSSLINALGEQDFGLRVTGYGAKDAAPQGQRVGAISEKWGRGSHTTTQGVLLHLTAVTAEGQYRLEKLRGAPVVTLDGDAYVGKYELNKASIEGYLRNVLLPGVLYSPDVTEPIHFGNSGINKLTYVGMSNIPYMKSIVHIPALLANAVLVAEMLPSKKRTHYQKFRHLVSCFSIDGEEYVTRIILGGNAGTWWLYHQIVTKIKKETLLDVIRVKNSGQQPILLPKKEATVAVIQITNLSQQTVSLSKKEAPTDVIRKANSGQESALPPSAKPIYNDSTLVNLLQGFFADFCVIDTPGVRRFVLHGPGGRDVVQFFPEMAPLALKCRFGASCTHTVEKGCAILAALGKGKIHPDRYESLMRIVNEK